MSSTRSFDAVVIGAGHNGLVAAAYLGRAGRRVLVLERREVVGGAAVTEEIAPGYRVSTAAYSLSLLRPDVYQDLELKAHGLALYPKDPQMFVPLPDGRHFFIWRDEPRTRGELERIHPPDADAYSQWGSFVEEAAAAVRPLLESPDPPSLREAEALLARRGKEDLWRLAVAGSAAETVERFFESDEVRGALASQGIIGTYCSPRDPGTAWVMTYHFAGGEVNGATGTWAYVRGGMGGVSDAVASSARAAGVEIRTGVDVQSVLIEGGRARGVVLEDGEEVRAPSVLSGADPRATFLSLVPADALDDEFLARVEEWRTDPAVVKVNMALAGLPEFSCLPGRGPQHEGTIEISPSIAYLEKAYQQGRDGSYPDEPYMEVYLQSTTDSTLAPEGGHVLSAFTQYAPLDAGDWGAAKAEALERVVGTLEGYAPNLRDILVAADVLGPPEIEARFGMTGGDIFHGSILPEQSFGERFSYRTPLPGLYLCGSGASPGGGVMGAAGRNCAKVILSE